MTAPRTRIKICGVRDVSTARAAVSAGADFVGVVLAPDSPRRVDAETARAVAAVVQGPAEPVALFQLQSIDECSAAAWPHPWVQLHGAEDEALVEAVAARHRIIRGFRFTPDAVRRWDTCAGVEVLLVDGSSGGGGTAFDHEALRALRPEIRKPIMLAGGLDASNVAQAVTQVQPWGVDVSSGVEVRRGVKDVARIEAFCAAVRASGR